MTLTYLFSAEVTPSTKIAFFSLCLVDLWENGRRYRNDFNGQLLGNRVWAFQRHQNQPPNLTPSPIWGSKTWKNAKNGFYHFQMIKLCGEVFPIENLLQQSCLHICLENNCEEKFEIGAKLHFYADFSAPLDWRNCANFKQLYYRSDWIDLNVQYTVGKDMKRSTSWPNFNGKVYHLQGQNIGETSENSVIGL